MANRAYLFNTERLVRNPYRLRDDGPAGGGRFVEIAEWARSIPVPWLLAFRQQDAYPFTHEWAEDVEDPQSKRRVFAGYALAALRERVLENLRASLPIMVRVTNEPRLARDCLDGAIRAFETLELPYVLLAADEVVDGDYDRLLKAIDGTLASAEALRDWAAYSGEAGLWVGFGPEPEEDDEPEPVDAGYQALLRAAEGGDVESQFRLAFEVEDGPGASDHGGWLTRAARAGHVEAQAHLAALYARQLAPMLAMRWLKSAAEAGHAEAAAYLARVQKGDAAPENFRVTRKEKRQP